MTEENLPLHRRFLRRRTIAVAAAAASGLLGCAVGVGAGHAGAASPAAVPGDRQSPVVAELAEEALAALDAAPASGFAAGPSAELQFRRLLAEAAEVTALQVGAEPREMQLAWLAADRPHQVALLTALTQLGAPYRSMSSDPEVGFDCSGLTSFAWRNAGLEIARQSGEQINAAAERDAESAMAGDLVQYPGHVMISLGVPAAVVHASNPENDVELWVASEGRADNLRYGDPTTSND